MSRDKSKTKNTPKRDWQRRTEDRTAQFFEKLKSRRVELFVEKLRLGPEDIVLDLGSEDGSYLSKYYPFPENIVIADIDEAPMKRGVAENGLRGYRVIPREGALPFDDGEFDAVWCNSVIEHVTIPRENLSKVSSSEFLDSAEAHQRLFAQEISRVARSYFVQTPNKHFPIESHSIMPFIAYLSQTARFRLAETAKPFWIKQWTADFYLYDRKRFMEHFPDASEILQERAFGLPKSFIAVKSRDE